jgi:ABC-type bacteriocin/lantibiotic exporter with double-glycine peptidase domain
MVPPIATANYLQRDTKWAHETIGGSNERIASVGCAVCTLAMALDHYGIKITPKGLNDYLKSNAGYTRRGWLKWDSVSKISEGRVSLDYLGKPTFQKIDAALTNGEPVIAKVVINQTPHWVLIVGKEKNEYLIRDPLGGGKSLRQLSYYRSGLYEIRILKASR